MQNELIREGLVLMLAGMGTVFVFLTALVFAMGAMSRLIPAPPPVDDDEHIAAIAAAIDKHRKS